MAPRGEACEWPKLYCSFALLLLAVLLLTLLLLALLPALPSFAGFERSFAFPLHVEKVVGTFHSRQSTTQWARAQERPRNNESPHFRRAPLDCVGLPSVGSSCSHSIADMQVACQGAKKGPPFGPLRRAADLMPGRLGNTGRKECPGPQASSGASCPRTGNAHSLAWDRERCQGVL